MTLYGRMKFNGLLEIGIGIEVAEKWGYGLGVAVGQSTRYPKDPATWVTSRTSY